MNQATKHVDGATVGARARKRQDRADKDAMSPSMRRLILSFGDDGSDRVWDPDVYMRRPNHTAGSNA
jgi:hypothetical protein